MLMVQEHTRHGKLTFLVRLEPKVQSVLRVLQALRAQRGQQVQREPLVQSVQQDLLVFKVMSVLLERLAYRGTRVPQAQLVHKEMWDPRERQVQKVRLETLAPKVSLETLVLTVIVLTKLLFLTGSQALNPNGWIALLGLKDQQDQDLLILENGILQPPTTSVMS
jgi:hypothetical protein